MNVAVTLTTAANATAANEPQGVEIVLPDWNLGGTRERFTLSLWEALEVRARLNELFGG